MKIKEIKELINFIAASGLNKVKIETSDLKLEIIRSISSQSGSTEQLSGSLPETSLPQVIDTPISTSLEKEKDFSKSDKDTIAETPNFLTVKSPMIGTFYQSSDPESDPFVKVGDIIQKGQILCIIEAMKLFNEIESEYEGKIVKIIAENASPVEYDQPLFLIEPI